LEEAEPGASREHAEKFDLQQVIATIPLLRYLTRAMSFTSRMLHTHTWVSFRILRVF